MGTGKGLLTTRPEHKREETKGEDLVKEKG